VEPLNHVQAISPGFPAATAARAELRRLIMDGTLLPGTVLPQVQLAARLGISRTPLREAMRMLQEEGLVEAEPQKRARVARLDPAHVEAVYVQRVMYECAAVLVSASRVTNAELDAINAHLADMDAHSLSREPELWHAAHRAFHLALIGQATAAVVRITAVNIYLSERYRRLYQRAGPRAWAPAFDEHSRIASAIHDRNGDDAAAELAAHLARTALMLIAEIAPAHEPAAVRASMALFHARTSLPLGKGR
jgi:DNA-binding GntR family transcriptional regulator